MNNENADRHCDDQAIIINPSIILCSITWLSLFNNLVILTANADKPEADPG